MTLISIERGKRRRGSSYSQHLCRFSTYGIKKVAALTSTIETMLEWMIKCDTMHVLTPIEYTPGKPLWSLSSDTKKKSEEQNLRDPTGWRLVKSH